MAADLEIKDGDQIVRIEGLRKTLAALSKAGADAEQMRDLMHTIGNIVVKAAVPPVLTGRLASTIRAGRGKTKAVVRAGGARAKYAGVIHYGWPARGIPANPFLRRALAATRNDQLQTLNQGIDQLLKDNDLK